MTKSATSDRSESQATRTPAPFVWLEPAPLQRELPAGARKSLPHLQDAIGDHVQLLVRSLVNYTVSRQNAESRSLGRRAGVQLSVLNRRRRAARAWFQAISAGAVDSGTLHALASTWLPQLIASGPDLHRSARVGDDCIEFVRGAITALVLQCPADNMLREAHALHALESILGMHLRAWRAAVARRLPV